MSSAWRWISCSETIMRRHLILPLILFLLLAAGKPASAEVVVVMRSGSAVERLSRDEVTHIFLGRYRTLPSGIQAQPIDQAAGSSLRSVFYQRLVNKTQNEINAYWARLHFSGKTSPPIQAASNNEAFERLLASPGAISYMDRAQVDGRLRIVFEFSAADRP